MVLQIKSRVAGLHAALLMSSEQRHLGWAEMPMAGTAFPHFWYILLFSFSQGSLAHSIAGQQFSCRKHSFYKSNVLPARQFWFSLKGQASGLFSRTGTV